MNSLHKCTAEDQVRTHNANTGTQTGRLLHTYKRTNIGTHGERHTQ